MEQTGDFVFRMVGRKDETDRFSGRDLETLSDSAGLIGLMQEWQTKGLVA
jgi:hypothetical protein